MEDLNLPSPSSNGRFDFGRDYFDWNVIKSFMHPQDKTIIVRTIMQVIFIPRYIPKGTQYNPKISTGMVGLENLGATCYLNALLQVSYCESCIIPIVVL